LVCEITTEEVHHTGHLNRTECVSQLTDSLKRVKERERIHDGRHHPHLVSASAVHSSCGALDPPEEIPAPHDDPKLNSILSDSAQSVRYIS
jgi:hypothetical protein